MRVCEEISKMLEDSSLRIWRQSVKLLNTASDCDQYKFSLLSFRRGLYVSYKDVIIFMLWLNSV